jgi:sugar-specific transcriptional regulator TrmB
MEAKFYLKLLETGATTTSELAHAMGVKRTTAYLYIDALVNKGLATKIVKGTKKQIAPTEPENLEALVEEKFTSAKNLKHMLPSLLEDIKQTFPSFKEINNFQIKSYKGIHNARNIYEEAFAAQEVRAYARIDPEERLWPDNAHVFEDAFKRNTKLLWKEFIYDPGSAVEISDQIVSHTDRYVYRFMPKHLKLSSEDILIYDGKVAIINYRGGQTSVVLQSPDFYNNLKELFDFMWSILATLEQGENK